MRHIVQKQTRLAGSTGLISTAYTDMALKKSLRVCMVIKCLPIAEGQMKDVIQRQINCVDSIVILLGEDNLDHCHAGDFLF